jgi:hypothetical protein
MSPVEKPKPVVACAVTSDAANERLRRAVDREEGHIVRIPPSQITVTRSHGFSALIYDLFPWDDRALLGINRLRRSRPELPVLLYVPPMSGAVALLPRCGRIPNLRLRMQERNGDGVAELQQDVGWLVRSAAGREILTRLGAAMPQMPPAMRHVAEYVLRTVGTERRPTVGAAARALRLSKRTLERRAQEEHLPPPKELIDWLTFMHVAFIAVQGNMSISKVARCIKVNANDLYRMKRRLAERAGRRLSQARDFFDDVVAAFVARCAEFAPVPARTSRDYTVTGYLTY